MKFALFVIFVISASILVVDCVPAEDRRYHHHHHDGGITNFDPVPSTGAGGSQISGSGTTSFEKVPVGSQPGNGGNYQNSGSGQTSFQPVDPNLHTSYAQSH